MSKVCRACHSENLGSLPFHVPEDQGRWFRCKDCGSDTSNWCYRDVEHVYGEGYVASEVKATGGNDARKAEVRSNCDWFTSYHKLKERTYLDVGCCDGAAMAVMQDRLGFAVHGFDAHPTLIRGTHVTVFPHFSRWLFPRRYACVMCREVIEHVPTPHALLVELWGATLPGGLVQVQTPKPLEFHHWIPYQSQHLCIFSPNQMRKMLEKSMLEVVDKKEWDLGQAWLCRAEF